MAYAIRPASERELVRLQRIEDDAGRLYGTVSISSDLPGVSLEALREGQRQELLWVMAQDDETPVGFALCWLRPGALHLRELDVHPDHGRRGLGGRLLAQVAAEARRRALPRVTLTTFADVPWNAPYYERHGYRRLRDAELPGWLAAIRREETEAGLDRWPRLAMSRSV